MTGTNCDLFTHKSSQSYLNHLVYSPGETFNQQRWWSLTSVTPYALRFPPRPISPWQNTWFSTFNRDAYFRLKHVTWSTFKTTHKNTYSGEKIRLPTFNRDAFPRVHLVTWSITSKSPATSGLSRLNLTALLLGWACHVINNFIISYHIHTKRIITLYSPGERCNQQRWWNDL
jgi:hypothetical protein